MRERRGGEEEAGGGRRRRVSCGMGKSWRRGKKNFEPARNEESKTVRSHKNGLKTLTFTP
jgi:hypothetical protein